MSKVNVIQAPTTLPPGLSLTSTIFLSGTITGTPSWQSQIIDSISLEHSGTNASSRPITILNPLNSNWDSTWKESKSFPPFATQVNWELEGLEKADIVVVYFGKEAKAPISLMELGLSLGRGKKVVVGCEDGFWKKGNVEIVCERSGVTVCSGLEEVKEKLNESLNVVEDI